MADEMSCAVCGDPLVRAARGRPRRFCSTVHRQLAAELRSWASRAAAGYAANWRAVGNTATAERILEEAALVEAGRYREALALRQAAHDRQREELAAAYRGRGSRAVEEALIEGAKGDL
jgi:endogenous inhibitor of DNA gyrase (YacG/DUF329 family)